MKQVYKKEENFDMQVAINFQNETIAQKVLWILDFLQNS